MAARGGAADHRSACVDHPYRGHPAGGSGDAGGDGGSRRRWGPAPAPGGLGVLLPTGPDAAHGGDRGVQASLSMSAVFPILYCAVLYRIVFTI